MKDKTNLLIAHACQGSGPGAGDISSVQFVDSGGGTIEAAQEIHEGTFSGTGGSHDSDVFIFLHLQGDAVEGMDAFDADFVDFFDVR